MFETEGYEIDWLSIGDTLWDPAEEAKGHNLVAGNQLDLRATISQVHRRMQWLDASDGIEGPMSPVLGIRGLIESLPVPTVTAFSYNAGLGTYQVLGIEMLYTNQGKAQLVAVDRGTDVIPVAVFRYFEENNGE